MKFIKGLLKLIFSLVTFVIIIPALAIALLPASTWLVQFAGTFFSFFTDFWWMSLAIGGVTGFIVFAFLKILPIRNNAARFFTELAIYGLLIGGLVYWAFTQIPASTQTLPDEAMNFVMTYAPFLDPVIHNNLYIVLAGSGLVLVCLIIDAIIRKLCSAPRAPKDKRSNNYGRNVVSSAEVDKVDLSAVKPKRYVKDIWGHYIEEDEYNARINSVKEKRL